MKYYKLRGHLDSAGFIPQSSTLDESYHKNIPERPHFLSWDPNSDSIPFIDGISLNRGAKFTDFIKCAYLVSKGIIISDKLLSYLSLYKLSPCSSLKVHVLNNESVSNSYNLLYAKGDYQNEIFKNIDYCKSIFQISLKAKSEPHTVEKRLFRIKNYDEYLKSINTSKKFFNQKFDYSRIKNYQLVVKSDVHLFFAPKLVSASLKETLINEKISGIRFEEIKWIISESDVRADIEDIPYFDPLRNDFNDKPEKNSGPNNINISQNLSSFISAQPIPENALFIDSEGNELIPIPTVDDVQLGYIRIDTEYGKVVFMKVPDDFEPNVESLQERTELFLKHYVDAVLKSEK